MTNSPPPAFNNATPPPTAHSANFDPMTAPATPRKTRWVTPALALAATLIVGLVGGVGIGQSTASTSTSATTHGSGAYSAGAYGSGAGRPAGGMGGQAGPGGGTTGTITSIDGSTITLKLAGGSTVSVTTKDTTTVTKSTKSTVAGLAAGDTISVRGTTDASGAVAATRITEGQSPFGGTPSPANTK